MMNLKQQYEQLIRNELKLLGCNKQFTDDQLIRRDGRDSTITLNIQDYELRLLSNLFYSVVHRLFKQKPRRIVKYQGFDDKGNSAGLANLEEKIIRGDSLVPHLSKSIFDIDQAKNNDPMLNEWSIYHFHIPPTDGNVFFVNRSRDLLFAIITKDEKFIFLDIQPHSDNTGTYEPWVDVGIIEKIEEHYPQLLARHYVGDGRTPLTAQERKNLRDRNANTALITTNGKEYRIPGCGTVAAGLPINSIRRTDVAFEFLKGISESQPITLSFDADYNLVAN